MGHLTLCSGSETELIVIMPLLGIVGYHVIPDTLCGEDVLLPGWRSVLLKESSILEIPVQLETFPSSQGTWPSFWNRAQC